MLNMIRNKVIFILLIVLIASLAACGGDQEPTAIVLPTATPGVMAVTPTPTVIQSETSGRLQVGFNIGVQDFAQQGAGVLSQTERGTTIKLTFVPAPGTVQQISIRKGRCENWSDLQNFQWVESLEPAIGGISETSLPNRHISTILDGNHAIAVSIPGGTFSQVATCGDLPDLSNLEIPEIIEG